MGPAHSSVGIMQGEWTRKDLRDAARSQLRFAPGQIALLQVALLRRLSSPGVTVLPGPIATAREREHPFGKTEGTADIHDALPLVHPQGQCAGLNH
jgi:hypothetical protein